MRNPIPHIIHHNCFWVSPQRCLFWEQESSLIVADLHLGKAGHFRKSGIAVPQNLYKADLQRLITLLYFYKAERLIIVGDFTHSHANNELGLFLKWRKDFSSLTIDLVKGNHDILADEWYREANIRVHEEEWQVDGFLFRHEQEEMPKKKPGVRYSFSGHLHPGIHLKGPARQSLHFPCFYFGRDHCILPAFSRFTGTFQVRAGEGETVYAITPNELVKFG